MANKTIITIGRQYGSGGREIGELLAKTLGIPCYDKELLSRAAKDSGFCEEIMQSYDEKPTGSFLYSLVMDAYAGNYASAAFLDMPINQKVFLAQFDAIKKIADDGPCVIVGRCADYALSDRENVLHVFLHADDESRIHRIARRREVDLKKAKDLMVKTDKKRASYYNYYTNKRWGEAGSYDLSLNTRDVGIEGAVHTICQFIEQFEQGKQVI